MTDKSKQFREWQRFAVLCKQLEVFKHFINGVKPQLCQRQTPQCHSCTTCFGLQLILSQLYGVNCIRCLEKTECFIVI